MYYKVNLLWWGLAFAGPLLYALKCRKPSKYAIFLDKIGGGWYDEKNIAGEVNQVGNNHKDNGSITNFM